MIDEIELAPDSLLSIYANGGIRTAAVIAAIGNERLIEYEMPKGSTALRLINVNDPDGPYKTISYRAVPRKWLEAIVAAGIGWQGRQQGNKRMDKGNAIYRVEKSPEALLDEMNQRRGGKNA